MGLPLGCSGVDAQQPARVRRTPGLSLEGADEFVAEGAGAVVRGGNELGERPQPRRWWRTASRRGCSPAAAGQVGPVGCGSEPMVGDPDHPVQVPPGSAARPSTRPQSGTTPTQRLSRGYEPRNSGLTATHPNSGELCKHQRRSASVRRMHRRPEQQVGLLVRTRAQRDGQCAY